MTMVLYGRPMAGSLAVEFLLAELGLAHRRVLVTGYGDGVRPASFAAVNPLRQVPALTLADGSLLTESGAILFHLAESHPGLAPLPDEPGRAVYLRWMFYMAATIYPTAMQIIHPENYIDDERRFPAIVARAEAVIARQWAVIEDALGDHGRLAGAELSAADLYALMFALWFPDMATVAGRPATVRLVGELSPRPAIAAVLLRNRQQENWA
ncbi:MAG: glutathione S-transferase family protein [Proteobacteria bacterium]|nr:glutathione S-transferase family protein [Pseudomonadota bacterium]